MDNKIKVLRYLEENAKYTAANIAAAIGIPEAEVSAIIKECEDNGTIVGYKTIINWNELDSGTVLALIEVNVRPMKGEGFDSVAKKISEFTEVKDLYLMSGGFDLGVMIEGKTMKDVARFVFDKLSVIDGVTGTATHFILNEYKCGGVSFIREETDTREYLF